MTDKQIIIHGVDVSGCKYYIADNGVQYNGCYELTDICECNKEDDFCESNNNSNCYYKQLKRKEQECNSYKQTLREIQQDLEYATYCESQECGCDDPNECLECTKNQIIQKIRECEVENDNK